MNDADRIIFVLLAEASSSLRIRQKRTPSSSGQKLEASSVSGQTSSEHPNPGWVRVMKGTNMVGIGIVVHPRIIVARASIFHEEVQYHVEYPSQSGQLIRHRIIAVKLNGKYKRLHEEPGGPHDVAMADTDGDMPKTKFVYKLLSEVGKFSPKQIWWICSRIGGLKDER